MRINRAPPNYRLILIWGALCWQFLIGKNTTFAQVGGTVPAEARLRMNVQGKVSLDSLTNYVHHHSDIRFSFNSRKIKGDRLIVFSKGSYDLKALLQHIKKGTGLYFFVYGRHIIFQDEPRRTTTSTSPSGASLSSTPPPGTHPHPQPAVKPARHPSTATSRPSSLGARQSFSNVHPSAPQSPFTHPPATSFIVLPHIDTSFFTNRRPDIPEDSFRVFRLHIGPIHLFGTKDTTRTDTTQPNTTQLAKAPQPTRDRIPNYSRAADKSANTSTRGPLASIDWHLQAGVFASEVMYVNPAIEAGIKPIHLLLSWGSNFHVQGWRIGLGSVIADNPNRQWQLMATYSPLKYAFTIDSGAHPINFAVKGQLYSAGIAWCKHFDPHWLFKISASLNFLHSTYYQDGVPAAPVSIFSSTENADTKAWLVRPPLMLRNTFDVNTTSNNKIWIGLSVGIYFDLKFF